MAIVQCNECGGDVSTKAASCPKCGAPFKAFMGPPKGFKDRFSEERVDHAYAEAKMAKKDTASSLMTTIVFWGLVIVVLAIFVF